MTTNTQHKDAYEVYIEYVASGEIVKVIECGSSERKAEKVLRGVQINLDASYHAYIFCDKASSWKRASGPGGNP